MGLRNVTPCCSTSVGRPLGTRHYMFFETAEGSPYMMVSTGWVDQVRMLDRRYSVKYMTILVEYAVLEDE